MYNNQFFPIKIKIFQIIVPKYRTEKKIFIHQLENDNINLLINDKKDILKTIAELYDEIDKNTFKRFLNEKEIYSDQYTKVSLRTAIKLIFYYISEDALRDILTLLLNSSDSNSKLSMLSDDYKKTPNELINHIREICIKNQITRF